MKGLLFLRNCSLYNHKLLLSSFLLVCSFSGFSQGADLADGNSKSNFWQQVRFGGSIGLAFGNGNFTGALAPSAIYNFNNYVSAGVGLSGAYTSGKNFNAASYGGSLIAMLRPIREIQLSAELEQLRINREFELETGNLRDKYWVPALFIGIGYNTGNVVAGIRYDILHESRKSFYADALTPFVSIYF